MPHDANGNSLQVGDEVVIPGRVIAIYTGEEYCNCEVELQYSSPPNTDKQKLSALNTRQTQKALVARLAPMDVAEAAYEAYRTESGGKSLVSGQPIPEWAKLSEPIQRAWRAAAAAVTPVVGVSQY